MKKENLILPTIIILLIAIIIVLFINNNNEKRDKIIETQNNELEKFETLKNIILNYPDFKDSKITIDKDKEKITVDEKYDIFIKNKSYMMEINNTKLENNYCKIVDAIEMDLGLKYNESLDTCLKTLEGSMNLGGIAAEIFDSYKILTVNNVEPAKIYNKDKIKKSDELISIDEINYHIDIDNYLFTSLSNSYDNNTKTFNICSNIYHPKKKKDNFIITIYDDKKELIDEKKYSYMNNTNIYSSFCIEYELPLDTVKYYSIKLDRGEKQ